MWVGECQVVTGRRRCNEDIAPLGSNPKVCACLAKVLHPRVTIYNGQIRICGDDTVIRIIFDCGQTSTLFSCACIPRTSCTPGSAASQTLAFASAKYFLLPNGALLSRGWPDGRSPGCGSFPALARSIFRMTAIAGSGERRKPRLCGQKWTRTSVSVSRVRIWMCG